MDARPNKIGCFTLEAFNSLGTTYYFYYIYFFTEKQFGFDKSQNLLLAAALGLTYGIASILGGRFAQRRGYFTALKVGYATMAITIGIAAFVQSLSIHLVLMFVAMAGMAITWPALEALVSEGDPRELPRNLGIYNLIWSGLGAIAYFTGGAIIEAGTFRALFVVAAALHLIQLALTFWVARTTSGRPNSLSPQRGEGRGEGWERSVGTDVSDLSGHSTPHPQSLSPLRGEGCNAHGAVRTPGSTMQAPEKLRSPVSAKIFLHMAWFANPFAYLAINTVIAVVPSLANRLQLTVVQAGIVCSVWLFTRTASFLWLWMWPKWHYRFRWLASAYVVMTVSVVAMLLAPNLWVLISAQVFFGLALGLIYYSSLYYSMDVGETKGEHGGFHEAMIGAGNFVGPGIAAIALRVFPNLPSSSTWAVLALMCCGLGGLLWLRFRRR